MHHLTTAEIITSLSLGVFTSWATVSDLRTRQIPNGLNLAALILGLVFQYLSHGWEGLGNSGLGFVLGFGTFFVLWLTGGGGGGDAKLMGALGVWLGFRPTLYVLIFSMMLVLIFTVFNRFRHAYLQKSNAQSGEIEEQGVALALPVTIATWSIIVADILMESRTLIPL
ncbi:MAG: prepilin peptidase [Planctomycetaceae bacterium]|nr:prepilin peptidase [Planctomycetaceae bacterium]